MKKTYNPAALLPFMLILILGLFVGCKELFHPDSGDSDFTETEIPGNNGGTSLSAPTNVTATVSGHDVMITWNTVHNATEYNVYRSNSSAGVYTTLVGSSSHSLLPDTGLPAGTYYYKVTALDGTRASSQSAASNPVTVTDDDPGGPTAVLTVTVTGTTTSSVSLSWNSMGGAYEYFVFRSDSGAYGSYLMTITPSGLTVTSYTDSGLEAGTTYYYTVHAVPSSGGAVTESDPVPVTTQSNNGPTGGIISNGSFSAVAGSSPWTLQTDGSRKSPAIGNDVVTKTRFSFTATAGAVLHINLTVSSESYDYAFIGPLDTSAAYGSSGNLASISGTDSETVTVTISAAGTHWIEIGYIKDSSLTAGSDCAWVEIMEAQGI